jgi:hypothetical protein
VDAVELPGDDPLPAGLIPGTHRQTNGNLGRFEQEAPTTHSQEQPLSSIDPCRRPSLFGLETVPCGTPKRGYARLPQKHETPEQIFALF